MFSWVSVGAGLLVTSYAILFKQLFSLLEDEQT